METMKKIVIIVLIMALVMLMAAGCKSTAPAEGTTSAQTQETATRIITDMAGRDVEIPASVEKIVPLANTPRMITYLGLADKAVGIGGMAAGNISPVTAYAYANKELWADVPIVGTDAAGATDYYPEEIIRADPDVILCSYTKELADEIQTKTGIPVVAVSMGTLFGQDYEQALRILADVCGVPERAEQVIGFIEDCLADLESRTKEIPDDVKPTVLGAAATFKGAHGIEGVYANYAVFEAIGAKDVTRGIFDTATGVLIDKEQVLEWNPDYLFLDSGGVNLVQTDYEKNTDFYAHLKAVEGGRIYQYPSSTSYYSNVEIPLVNSYYVASLIYAEQFSDIAFEDKANEIFKFFLGRDDYLSVLEGSGLGYGTVTLGAEE
jgi:iron complex transport system substrate-binding protein